MSPPDTSIREMVARRNKEKLLFTPGPASLLEENLTGLRPCFGRGDPEYDEVEERVLGALRALTGHRYLARLQGSASLALEIISLNYLAGRVLVVSSGYYSDRLYAMAVSALRRTGEIQEVGQISFDGLDSVSGKWDWVVACSTETSRGLRLPIPALARLAQRVDARLMLDATASVGLESDHELADVIGYSSCKGLFGLTGGAFIAAHTLPETEVDSFTLSLSSHLDRLMTGPYHAMASLDEVLPRHGEFREAVVVNKGRFLAEMAEYLTHPPIHEPLLCTRVSVDVQSVDPRAVLYRPRGPGTGSVVCHLGEVHLGPRAKGAILDTLTWPGRGEVGTGSGQPIHRRHHDPT